MWASLKYLYPVSSLPSLIPTPVLSPRFSVKKLLEGEGGSEGDSIQINVGNSRLSMLPVSKLHNMEKNLPLPWPIYSGGLGLEGEMDSGSIKVRSNAFNLFPSPHTLTHTYLAHNRAQVRLPKAQFIQTIGMKGGEKFFLHLPQNLISLQCSQILVLQAQTGDKKCAILLWGSGSTSLQTQLSFQFQTLKSLTIHSLQVWTKS